jgi:hypothetical protein
MIQERVRAGLARARAEGTKSGRPMGRPKTDKADGHRSPAEHYARATGWASDESPNLSEMTRALHETAGTFILAR